MPFKSIYNKMARRKQEIDTIIDDETFNEEGFSLIADFHEGGEHGSRINNLEEELPILPLRNMLLFPTTVLPVSIGRESSLKLVKELEKSKGNIAVFCQKDPVTEIPSTEDLYETGTAARIIRVFEMPDKSTTVILQGFQKIELKDVTRLHPYHRGRVIEVPDQDDIKDEEYKILIKNCRATAVKINLSPAEIDRICNKESGERCYAHQLSVRKYEDATYREDCPAQRKVSQGKSLPPAFDT